LTLKEQNRNIACRLSKPKQSRNFVMLKSAPTPDVSRYEQACDQAIAMCDGNMRSTIKALIMANEYLETELQELQAAALSDGMPARLPQAETDAA
jgi:hypothetical protein